MDQKLPNEHGVLLERAAHTRIRLAYVDIKPMQDAGTSERLTSLCKRANELLDAVALVPISIESASVDAKVRFISELRICADLTSQTPGPPGDNVPLQPSGSGADPACADLV